MSQWSSVRDLGNYKQVLYLHQRLMGCSVGLSVWGAVRRVSWCPGTLVPCLGKEVLVAPLILVTKNLPPVSQTPPGER